MTLTDDQTTPVPAHVPVDLVYDFDFYNMGAEVDVHRFYRALHDRPDVPDIFWTPRNGGHWVVTRYADLVRVFEDRETFSSRQQLIPAPPEGLLGLVNLDGEEHSAFRKLVQPSLTTPFVEGNREGERIDAYIARICNELIDELLPRGGCEFFTEFSTKMPIEVVMRTLVDLPEEDLPRLMPLVDAVAHAGADPEKFGAAFFGLAMYFASEIIPKRRANPGNDMLSAIVHGTVMGRALTDEEIIAMCNVMIIGGLDTVTSMLLYIVWHLAEHPEHRRRLRDEPALIPKAVEELLRRYAILNVCRYVTRDTEFNGIRFAEGDLVLVPSTAGAVDERQYPGAMTVDFDRADKKHVSFSRGAHSCVGSLLARREMRIFIAEWLRRIPDFSVKPGTTVEMQAAIANRIKELHLVWDVPDTTTTSDTAANGS